MSSNSDLAFCYVLPNINEVTDGIVFIKDNIVYVKLINYGLEALVIDYVNINMDQMNNIKKTLVNKLINVQIIRMNKIKGYIDVKVYNNN
ncbi:putative eIF2 alpha-like PKR inhibitor [Lumpy skin disease virus]|uniref:EIF2 alpha-like PKR inhibitor n=1 Tax=Lumpy skin disease virus TaxID=59509 RepID=Q77GE9_LSDV|nr:EIF2a-like PKR inhibitor [Lumpy skin disease virus NI-2490]AAK43554.1 unknown [Lumpy skin disease virus]AAN02580.1 putative eIF2 alpha-like PKR inhibitor [Lumpy skin disease virus NW-LW]AAK84975.1 LSDV014 putative eIF2 alpha-like PKR inhibitor [Lumpy skin disease virus NI-2490]AAN02738.1 putative eIF2 alpha-like PKR inhibitor [Lumpy skin disease virus]AOE47590.1 EIF2a-like PKR inhibitor [Lumpy skin disease virus]